MKTHEYLVIFKNDETLKTIDMFYIDAYNIREAHRIASDLMHEYDNVDYYTILASVVPA